MKKSLLYRSFTILLIVSMFISGSAALASDKPVGWPKRLPLFRS